MSIFVVVVVDVFRVLRFFFIIDSSRSVHPNCSFDASVGNESESEVSVGVSS
jgi:hypothetical protein